MAHPEETRAHRNRSIRNAVSTSLLSKASSLILQFASLPIAARVLGKEEFGIYATVSLAVMAVAMLQLGVGPALARGISEAVAKSDRARETRLYLSGAVLVGLLGALGLAVVALILHLVPIPVLFGEKYQPWIHVMRPALWIGACLMAGMTVIAHTDRVREGYMEAAVVNTWGAAGNLLSALIVALGIHASPSVSFLLLAVYLPNIVARAGSTFFLWKKRPWLISAPPGPDRTTMIQLIRDGLAFSATSFLLYLVEAVLCALIVGRLSGPGQVAIFQVLMTLAIAFTGLIIMVGTPLWAAMVDARERNDHHWLTNSVLKYYRYLAFLILVAAIGMIGLGPWIIPLWYGPEFAVDRLLTSMHVLFLAATGWRHVNRTLAIGLGFLNQTVWPILIGLGLGLAIGVWGLQTHGLWALFGGLAAGTLLIPGLTLPRLVWKNLGKPSD